METQSYNSLLDAIQRPSEWNYGAGLVGTSAGMREFIASLAIARARFEQDPDAAHLVVVYRAPCCGRLDDSIQNHLGLENAKVIFLRRDSPFNNDGLLFGVGPRQGAFEFARNRCIVVKGVEYLNEQSLERLVRHWRYWRASGTITALLVGPSHGHESIIANYLDWANTLRAKLPPLIERREDIPWALHHEAVEFGGGLNDFRPEAVTVLKRHCWPGDLGELAAVVRFVYKAQSTDNQRSFGVIEVQKALEGAIPARSINLDATPLHVWGDIQNLATDCDRRTMLLMGIPFFLGSTLPAQAAPLSSEWPEMNLARLISWSYMTFVEAAEPNAKAILRLAGGLALEMRGLKSVRANVGALRTFEQHRLDAGSSHDKKTISTVCDWFELACERRHPEVEDVERLISRLLIDVKNGLTDVVAFLQAVDRDSLRDLILQQWRDFVERQWPKHRFDSLVASVLEQMGRGDLRSEFVAEKLLSSLQSTLAATADGEDKENIIRSEIECRVHSEFPKKMPFDGRDVMALGIKGDLIGQILEELRSEFRSKNSTREELLSLAKRIVNEKYKST